MTKPTSETIRVLNSEQAMYSERLQSLNAMIHEVVQRMNDLRRQAVQTSDVINSIQAAIDRLEKYEEEYPEVDFPPHQDFPEDKQTGFI